MNTRDQLSGAVSALAACAATDDIAAMREALNSVAVLVDRLELEMLTGTGERTYQVVLTRWRLPLELWLDDNRLVYAGVVMTWPEPVTTMSEAAWQQFCDAACGRLEDNLPGSGAWEVTAAVELPPETERFYRQLPDDSQLEEQIARYLRNFPGLYDGEPELARLRVLRDFFLELKGWTGEGVLDFDGFAEQPPSDEDLEQSRLLRYADGWYRPSVGFNGWHGQPTLDKVPDNVADDHLLGMFEILDYTLGRPVWELYADPDAAARARARLLGQREALVSRFSTRLEGLGILRPAPEASPVPVRHGARKDVKVTPHVGIRPK